MPKTNQQKVINAPVDDVWKKFNNFHDLSWAPNVITAVEKVGDIDGGHVGAKRVLNEIFHETLLEIDDGRHVLRYSIDDGPAPISREDVSNYVGRVQLSQAAAGEGTVVEWTSSWEADKEDAVEFCQGVYVALLDDLEKAFSP